MDSCIPDNENCNICLVDMLFCIDSSMEDSMDDVVVVVDMFEVGDSIMVRGDVEVEFVFISIPFWVSIDVDDNIGSFDDGNVNDDDDKVDSGGDLILEKKDGLLFLVPLSLLRFNLL